MVGALIGKGLCNLRLHRVDSWTYTLSGLCLQGGICQRCGVKCNRLRHDWGGFSSPQICRRCGEVKPDKGDTA